MDWLSLLLPTAYLAILITSLGTFSHLYRSRKASHQRSLAPWFPPHLQRNIYHSLLELSQTAKVPDSVLKAALFRRATEDIHRVLSLRTQKPALAQLLQRGSVGDELWQRFLIAEREIEAELKEVVEEANALSPGWGQVIFQSASEAAHNENVRKKVREMEGGRAEETRAWARQKESVREGFLRELGGEEKKEKGGVPAVAAAAGGSGDEDGVLIDGSDPDADVVTTPGGGAKKKKGKK